MTAVTFAVLLPSLLVAHHVADHWIQTDWQAKHKGDRDPWYVGRLACASHVATYTATTATAVALLWWLFALPITPLGFVLGQAVSAVTHYWADRRFTLQRLCERLGKGEFYRLGAPRGVHAATRRPLAISEGTFTAVVGRIVDVKLVTADGQQASWDNPSLGTGSYALDQSWHWAWLFVAALVTALA